MSKKINKIQLLGVGATVMGLVGSLITSYVSDKQLDDKVERRVKEELKKRGIKNDNEEE